MRRPDSQTRAARLRASAARLEQAADVHARAASALAGRAAFRRGRGEADRAAQLDRLLRDEERREADALARAAALRLHAARQDACRGQVADLIALFGRRPAPGAHAA